MGLRLRGADYPGGFANRWAASTSPAARPEEWLLLRPRPRHRQTIIREAFRACHLGHWHRPAKRETNRIAGSAIRGKRQAACHLAGTWGSAYLAPGLI